METGEVARLKGKRVVGLDQLAEHVGNEDDDIFDVAVFVSYWQHFGRCCVGFWSLGEG